MSFMQKMIDETQMPITQEHAFKEKSTKLLIFLPLRTIYNRTFQCETPCIISRNGMVGCRDNSISLIHLIRINANTPLEF